MYTLLVVVVMIKDCPYSMTMRDKITISRNPHILVKTILSNEKSKNPLIEYGIKKGCFFTIYSNNFEWILLHIVK